MYSLYICNRIIYVIVSYFIQDTFFTITLSEPSLPWLSCNIIAISNSSARLDIELTEYTPPYCNNTNEQCHIANVYSQPHALECSLKHYKHWRWQRVNGVACVYPSLTYIHTYIYTNLTINEIRSLKLIVSTCHALSISMFTCSWSVRAAI